MWDISAAGHIYDGNTEGEIIHEVFAERNCVHGHRK